MKGRNVWVIDLVFVAVAILNCGHLLVAPVQAAQADARWGRLANPSFDTHRIKATLFFPGQAKDRTNPYECNPGSNLPLYTVHPADDRHLNWAMSGANRTFAIDRMVEAGINVAVMSSWGEDFLPCSTAWTPWAPMQCSTRAHNELFAASLGKHILIIPFIESRADWNVRNEFPNWGDQIAPGTVSQIVNFINRYIKNPPFRGAADKWAQVYDRNGQPRYAVALIHASSNQLGPNDHSAYAAGFGAVAQEVFQRTRIKVGFFLDALPPNTNAPGVFKPSWGATASFLKNEDSILGIMCFIPEIWVGSSSDTTLLNWKRDFSRGWANTGIPFLMDVCPGYDAHIVFPGSVRYGLNIEWTMELTDMVEDFGQDGLMYNSWNGYTEGMAAVVLEEYGDFFSHWLRTLTCKYLAESCADLIRCGTRLPGDINGDCQVNFQDLAQMAEQWLAGPI